MGPGKAAKECSKDFQKNPAGSWKHSNRNFWVSTAQNKAVLPPLSHYPFTQMLQTLPLKSQSVFLKNKSSEFQVHYFVLWSVSIEIFNFIYLALRKQQCEGGVESSHISFSEPYFLVRSGIGTFHVSLCGMLTLFLAAYSWAVKWAISGTLLTCPSQYTTAKE